MFHFLPNSFEHPVMGTIAAVGSATIYKVANAVDAIPPTPRGWMELGGSLGFIGGLIYAVVTLWNALQKSKEDIAKLNSDIRSDWKAQNDKLISVLEKLDPDDKK